MLNQRIEAGVFRDDVKEGRRVLGRKKSNVIRNVKVEGVRTSIAHGKFKRQGRFIGQRSDWKKAYVKLRDGQKIPEFLEGA